MSLMILQCVQEIGGFKIVVKDDYSDEEILPDAYINVSHEKNSITFTIQDGPIKDVGVNGCQLVTVIEFAKLMLEGSNKLAPCRENAVTITKLDEAIMWQEKRTKDREKRGVEGTSQK